MAYMKACVEICCQCFCRSGASAPGSALLGAAHLARWQTGSSLAVTGRLPVAAGLPAQAHIVGGELPAQAQGPPMGAHSDLCHMLTPGPVSMARPR